MNSHVAGNALPLLHFSESDNWTTLDAFESVAIFGSTGSGKSTASGSTLASSFLRAGFGGMVLCAKSNERARWEYLARRAGRSASLITISPDYAWHFNILDYALNRTGAGAGQAESIVTLITTIKDMVEGEHGLTSESYWNRATGELIRNAIPLLKLSVGRLSLGDLVNLILSSPTGEQMDDVVWQRTSFFWNCLQTAEKKATTARERHDMTMARRYWLDNFQKLADRTRSSIISTFSTMADVLLHGFLFDLFSTDTTIIPETTYRDGAILLLDLPIREYGESGVLAQRIFKYMFQQAVLRRDVTAYPRPVFLFCDEAHNFVSNFDYLYQAEARESHASSVYITQTIANYYAAAGDSGRTRINALLAHFQTRIFHANSDPTMNEWAAESIGKEMTLRKSYGASTNEFGMGMNISHSEQREYKVDPALFTVLRKGGAANQWQADAIVFQSGRTFNATGAPWLKAVFTQMQAVRSAASPIVTPAEPETPITASALLWFVALLMEWLLILQHNGQLIGDLVSGDYLQSLIQRDTDGTDNSHPVAVAPNSVSVPPPDIHETVRENFTHTMPQRQESEARTG